MLVAFKHGRHIPLTTGQTQAESGPFGYYFGDASEAPFDSGTLAALDAVHAGMVEATADTKGNHSSLPPVFAFFGQFIDHDITGMAEAETGSALPKIEDELTPQPRATVVQTLMNLRTGRFDLDSLYGFDAPTGDKALDKLNGLMRYPGDRALMWIGTYGDLDRRVTFPKTDPGGDLLRLDRLYGSGRFTEADIDALPQAHRALFRHPDGSLNLSRAIIGDARNDENLFIAQLHLAFLRFHNRVVQAWPKPRRAGDADEVFDWARTQVRRFYQWLVLNVWLPRICDPLVVRAILAEGPMLYDRFLQKSGWVAGDKLPLPLEFSTASYRFGHSMVRGSYDWNLNYGRGPDPLADGAGFDLMFLSTGSVPKDPATGRAPMGGDGPRLPGKLGADWDRLVHPMSAFADRTSRLIDTVLADPLTRMKNEGSDPISQNLIARNLRRGVLHNLPSAQAVIADLKTMGLDVPQLSQAQIASGATAGAVQAGGFDSDTPLWFYTLKEAELLGAGQRLGPLGSQIVAGTIIGLILRGPDPVWEVPGSHEGRWHPVDGPRVSGQLVDSFPALMRAALVMENPDFNG